MDNKFFLGLILLLYIMTIKLSVAQEFDTVREPGITQDFSQQFETGQDLGFPLEPVEFNTKQDLEPAKEPTELDAAQDSELAEESLQELAPSHESAQELESTQSPNSIISIDYIVAVVNEEVITRRELDRAVESATTQLQQQGIQLPDYQAIKSQVMESLIVKRIQLQRADEIGITVSDSELDETIQRIADENNLSLQAFYVALEEDGVNFNKFRNDVRDEVVMVRLREREVNSRVNVTDGEIDNFLRTQKTSAVGNDEYLIAHILVRVPEHIDALQVEERRQRAELVLAKLEEGVEFAQVAAEYSDSDDAMRGGVMDWRPAAQLGPRFAELLTTMQPGELTPIIQSPVGFHILKLLDQRAQEKPVVIIDQTNARHILIKVNELTSESDALQLIRQLKERIDNGASFEEIAKLHSEDNSASSGGDLGWISPGVTVPAFEKAMDTLLPGQISEPIQTQFGWHLIQVIERRSEDVSDEQQRQNAREAIHTRKADVVLEEWMQQLRDQAYVENRIEDG